MRDPARVLLILGTLLLAIGAAKALAGGSASAEAASRAISSEVGGHAIAMFLIGIGVALLIGGAVVPRRRV